ncbi:hypothetical protein BY996DRAFT_8467494 [Phakopsora pachyrhizi]|nr:hypothetical protein BY996DRAFT_8467494 [Phakopsora pachyrhizi]
MSHLFLNRLIGVNTLDVVPASTFAAKVSGSPEKAHQYKIPVIGGHSGVTILPLLSQSQPALPSSLLSDKTLPALPALPAQDPSKPSPSPALAKVIVSLSWSTH